VAPSRNLHHLSRCPSRNDSAQCTRMCGYLSTTQALLQGPPNEAKERVTPQVFFITTSFLADLCSACVTSLASAPRASSPTAHRSPSRPPLKKPNLTRSLIRHRRPTPAAPPPSPRSSSPLSPTTKYESVTSNPSRRGARTLLSPHDESRRTVSVATSSKLFPLGVPACIY
jgi:hypothetical protein